MWRITSAVAAAFALSAAPAPAAPTLVEVGDFHAPVHVAGPPNDARLFVVQQNGIVRVRDGTAVSDYLDVTAETLTDGSERGLLSIAFAPDFATSGLFYVFLTARPGGDLVVLEHRQMAGAPNRADPASRREVLRVAHPVNSNHNGGQLAFGPDGKLYVATGDGGAADDPAGNGQNLSSPLGKILRIEPSGAPVADNPFQADGQDKRIWSYGLRNPWRFSFDRVNGDLIIGDVGQGATEEIDWAPRAAGGGRGLNFGWDCYEGNTFRISQCAVAPANHTPPAYALSQEDGLCAIVGGFVVRDPGLPTLLGRYIYGDNCLAQLHTVTLGQQDARAEPGLTVNKPTSMGEDGCGRLYVAQIPGYAHQPGTVFQIVDGAPSQCPAAPPAAGGACEPAIAASRPQRPLRRGLLVRLSTRESCSVRISARVGSTIRFSTASLGAASGTRSARMRLGRRSRARLRAALARRSRRVRVSLVATGPAGSQSVSRRLTIRR